MATYKIKSIIYEAIFDDGTTEEREIVDEGRIAFLSGGDHDAKFWFASDLPDIANSNNYIAGCPTFDDYFEEGVTRNRKNTMIGIVEDGNYDLVLCAYTMPVVGLVK
jgi:hypothetical protein